MSRNGPTSIHGFIMDNSIMDASAVREVIIFNDTICLFIFSLAQNIIILPPYYLFLYLLRLLSNSIYL